MKLKADGSIRDKDQEEIDLRDSTNALAAVNTYHYTALRMYNYATWPDQGEIRDALDSIDKLPLFELDAMLNAAGFRNHDSQ